MVYSHKTTKYVGKHRHTRGVNLSQEADLVLQNVLKSSGFFKGQIAKDPFGTNNSSMDNFVSKWNNMNTSRKGRFRPYLGNFKQDLARAAS
jgi:hypothetical protein